MRSEWEARYDIQGEDIDKHAKARDRKHLKTHKMVVSNRSIFTIKDTIDRKSKEE